MAIRKWYRYSNVNEEVDHCSLGSEVIVVACLFSFVVELEGVLREGKPS